MRGNLKPVSPEVPPIRRMRLLDIDDNKVRIVTELINKLVKLGEFGGERGSRAATKVHHEWSPFFLVA